MIELWSDFATTLYYCLGAPKAVFPPRGTKLGEQLCQFRFPKATLGKRVSNRDALALALGDCTEREIYSTLCSERILIFGSAHSATDHQGEKMGTLMAFRLHAFVCTTCTIVEARSNPDLTDQEVRYYRTEHHPQAPGRIFAEAPTHTHIVGNGAPRFPCHPNADPILHFLEMIAIEHDYEQWLKWAEGVMIEQRLTDEFLEIQELYNNGLLAANLESATEKIDRFHQALHQAKSQFRRTLAPTMNANLIYQRG